MNIFERIERRIAKLLMGYTAEERAEITRRYIDWRVEQGVEQGVERVIVASLERLIAEVEAEDAGEQQDTGKQWPGWHDLRTGQPVAEQDLPPVVRAFAQRVSAAYDAAPKTTASTEAAEEGEARE